MPPQEVIKIDRRHTISTAYEEALADAGMITPRKAIAIISALSTDQKLNLWATLFPNTALLWSNDADSQQTKPIERKEKTL